MIINRKNRFVARILKIFRQFLENRFRTVYFLALTNVIIYNNHIRYGLKLANILETQLTEILISLRKIFKITIKEYSN